MHYSIQIKKSAFKEIRRLSKPERSRVIDGIDQLAKQPYVGKLLKGELSGLRRIRVGNYRIVYEVYESEVLVLVLRVAHRKHVYR